MRGCLGGFVRARLRTRTTLSRSSVFQGTLSARDVTTTPHGSAYCKSPNGRRVGSPAGQQPSSWERWGGWCRVVFDSLSLVYLSVGCPLGLRVSLHSGSSQQGPAPQLVLAPSATPRCSPISEAKRVYIVDSFIVAHNAQPTSLVPLLVWSHLQWQTKLSLSWRLEAVAWPLTLYPYVWSTGSRRATTAQALAPDSEDIFIQICTAI